MEKKEALEILNADTLFKIQRDTSITIRVAIETLIKEVTDSISKKKIEHDLEVCQNVYKKEMKPYQTEYGLDVTYLSKKEKNELVNKRNCLIVQMETHKQLLEGK